MKLTREAKRVASALNRAAKLVEKGWTQHTYAVNKQGFSCEPDSRGATKWCALGALARATKSFTDGWPMSYRVLSQHLGGVNLAVWNDDHSPNSGRRVAISMRAAAKKVLSGKIKVQP